MGSKPKQSEYKPSETEKTQAAIAKADADYFAKTYDPLLVEMRDKAAKEDVASTLRGRAGADTYQALTGDGANLTVAEGVSTGADLAEGAVGQLLDANTVAKNVKIDDQVGVLGTARGQQADAGDALAKASKLAMSEDLAKMKGKQTVRLARRKAAFDIGTSIAKQGIKNYSETGDWKMADKGFSIDPNTGEMIQRGGYGLLGGFKTGTRSTKPGGGFTDWTKHS
jgi:hypothetical protein